MPVLRIEEAIKTAGYKSPSSIYNRVREGTFTTPIKLGLRSVGWPSEEVEALNAAAIAGANDTELRELVKVLHTQRQAKYQAIAQSMGHTPKGIGQAGQSECKPRQRGRFVAVGV